MIFQQTWQKVLSGEKTQTRRIVKPGDIALTSYGEMVNQSYHLWPDINIFSIENANHWRIWSRNHIYAVQPGRGQKSVGRIQITNIRREDVRNISAEDVCTEGFAGKIDFLTTWAGMHDKSLGLRIVDPAVSFFGGHYIVKSAIDYMGLDEVLKVIATRPAKKYQAWVLEFRLITQS